MSRTTAVIIIVVTIIVMALGVALLKEAGGVLGIVGFGVIYYVIGELKKLNNSTKKKWDEVSKEEQDNNK